MTRAELDTPTSRQARFARVFAVVVSGVALYLASTGTPEPGVPGSPVVVAASPVLGGVTEYKLKAVFLLNFAKFTKWPDEAFESETSPFIVAVVGHDPFGSELDALKKQTVGGRGFEIKHFKSAEEIEHCHILFVPKTEFENLEEILEKIRKKSVMLVGESEGFAVKGGVVNFYIEDSKVRFEINPAAAARADLKISSKLLKLARIVGPKDGEEER